MPKNPIIYALLTLVQGLLFALLAWYQLQDEAVSVGRILGYGMLLSVLSSACVHTVSARRKKTGGGIYTAVGFALILGTIVAGSLLAELVFGPGGSKNIGALPVVVTVPLTLALVSPAIGKKKDA